MQTWLPWICYGILAAIALIAASVIHNFMGYVLGYWGARVFRRDERRCRTVALVFLFGCLMMVKARAEEFPIGEYPHAVLRRGGVELVVYLPDAARGINRAVRFDRSGFVARAAYKGHTWFGPWHKTDNPSRNDNVMGTAGEFGMGNNGMPVPLAFEAAKPGEAFVKIGVGVLRKKGDRYRFAESYDVERIGVWTVETESHRILFRQELNTDIGFSYRYEKRIEITEEPPGFAVEYRLANTGTRRIDQTYYAHNFVKIDDQPIGPDYRFTFAQAMTPDREMRQIAAVTGNVLTFARPLQTGNSIYTQFREHDLPAAGNGVLVDNRKSRAALRITGDAAISRFHFWSTDQVACPEPFVKVRVSPGDTFRWRDTYELLVTP